MSAGRAEKRRYPDDGWGGGGFGAYMKKKAAKLAKQFENGASETGDDHNGKFTKIFKGISIYVNGFTDPPASKLKKLMMMHGGRYIYYPNKSNTTHIVANNLAYTKIKEIKNEKVVTPKWITDSVEAGKLLPHAPYLIYRPKASNQSLHRFAYVKRSEREAEKEGTEGNVSAVEGPVTDKPCGVQPQNSSANMSGHTKEASNDIISDSSPTKRVSVNDMGKAGRGIVSSCNVRKEKHKAGGLCEEKNKSLVSEDFKSEQNTFSNGNHPDKFLKKKVQDCSDVKQSKLANVNGHVAENLFEKYSLPKCKYDSNNSFVNKSGQGSNYMQQSKVAGSSHQVKSPARKCPVPKYRKEVDSNAINKEKRKGSDIQQSEKDVIGQTQKSAKKNPDNKLVKKAVQQSTDVKLLKFANVNGQVAENLFEKYTIPKCPKDSNENFVNKGGHGSGHMQQSKVSGNSDQVKISAGKYRNEVNSNTVNDKKRKGSDIRQSEKGVSGQTKNVVEKNSDNKLLKKGVQQSTYVKLLKFANVNHGHVAENLFEKHSIPKCQKDSNENFVNKGGQGSNHKQQSKVVGSSDQVKNSPAKIPVTKYRKEVDSNTVNDKKRKGSDIQQSEKGVSIQAKNVVEKNSDNKLLKKGVQQSTYVKLLKFANVNHGHVAENLFEKHSIPKCQKDSNENFVNKGGQGSNHKQQSKVVGSSDQVKNSPAKSPVTKYRKEVDSSAKEKRKDSDIQQSKKAVIGQTKKSAEKNSDDKLFMKEVQQCSDVKLPKLANVNDHVAENLFEKYSIPKCKYDSNENFVNKGGQGSNHKQQSKVIGSSDQVKNSPAKSPVTKYRNEVDSNAVHKEKRKDSDIQQSKKAVIGQTKKSAEKNSDGKFLMKEVQQCSDVKLPKLANVNGHVAENLFEKYSIPKCKNDSNENFVNKDRQVSGHMQQSKVTGRSDQVKDSAGKSPVAKYRKEVDNRAVIKEEKKKGSDIQQSEKGVIGQTKNAAEQNSVGKSRNLAKNDCINKDGGESHMKQPAVQGQKIGSQVTSPLKKNGGDPSKSKESFDKGLQEQSSLNFGGSKSEECDPKELSTSSENKAAPSTQLNNCYFPKSNDPKFLPTFYRHSSFYHLTTWRAEHKIFVKKLHEKGDRSFPGKKKLMAMFQKNCPPDQNKGDTSSSAKVENSCESRKETEISISGSQDVTKDEKPRVIMHIDMDAFFVAVSLLNYPELRGKPVAVAHYAAKPKKAEKVVPKKEGQFESKSQGKGPPLKTDSFKKNMNGEISNEGLGGQQLSQPHSQGSGNGAPVHPGLGMVASESDNFTSLAAIASCSYEAREDGVRNGMLMKDAKELCPELRTIPYDFDGYHRVSRLLYETVASYTHDITAASCDEVVVDITNLMRETGATAIQIADVIRKEVFEKTQCTASAGLASNIILAKLCTKAAKPNGTFLLKDEDVADFLKKAPVGDLPGIGRAFNKKMHSLGVYTCEDLQKVAVKVLQKEFGPRTGEILYQNCRGCDTHHLTADRQRKYVSVEVNYGIRFDVHDDAYQFINLLCREINRKMKKLGMVGRRISLKLKIRRPGTPVEDPKFMGYGVSDDKIKSISLSQETNDAGTIERTCKSLFLHMGDVDAKDIRGVGIQLSLLKKLSKGQALSKSLTEMLPKKEDVPKSLKLVAPIDDKPKSRTYSMLDFMEKKNESSPGSPTKPETRPIRKWNGVPPLPFTMSPSQCLIPFDKVNSNYLKTEKNDCLISGKRETAMDIWSKSVAPSRPSSVRKLSFGGNRSGEKDINVPSLNLFLNSTESKKQGPEHASTLVEKSPFSGGTLTPTKTPKSEKFEKLGSDQPFTQFATSPLTGCTFTPSKTPTSDAKFEKFGSDQPISLATTTSPFSGFISTTTEIQTSDTKFGKSDSEQPFTLTAASTFMGCTTSPTETQQCDTKLEKSGPDQSITPNVTSSSPGCITTPSKTHKSDTKLEESDPDQPVIPTTTSPLLGHSPTPSTAQKSDTKFQLPPPTELDLSVLHSLPSEICDQIIQEYSSDETKDAVAIQRIKSYDPNKASTSTGITSELDQDVLQNLPPEILQEVLEEERRKVTKVISEEKSGLGNEPSSYSEIDKSCFEALPKDLQNEICEKYKPKPLSQGMVPDVKMSPQLKGDLPLPPDGKRAFSQKNPDVKAISETLPWRRDIREVLSMQASPSKKENLEDGNEMGIDGEKGGEGSDADDDGQGEPTERKEEADGWHKEEVTNLDGAIQLWDVKAKLTEWVDTFEDPLDEDINHVVHYLRTLILEQNLEKVYQVLRALKRIVNKNGKDVWKVACSTITKRIQTTIHQMYGSTLKLD